MLLSSSPNVTGYSSIFVNNLERIVLRIYVHFEIALWELEGGANEVNASIEIL